MPSSLRRLKIYYMYKWTGSMKQWTIFAILLVASLYFFIRPTSVDFVNNDQHGVEALELILNALPDTRPLHCRDHAYDFNRLETDETVSILTEFNGNSFYEMQLTLMSIIEHTPYDLYNEILVLDDGTTDSSIQRDLSSFLSNPNFNKVRVYKSNNRDGLTASRFKLAALAKSSILVFVHFRTIVNNGWLQPLLAKVISEPNLIAVPHYDNLMRGNIFDRITKQLVNVFTWDLSTVFIDSSVEHDDELIDTPVMRGEVFAVRRSFLEEIGGFDDNLVEKKGTGTHLELSLRAWRCGGVIRIVVCSRVTMKDMFRAEHIQDTNDLYHIAELWFENYQSLVYNQARVKDYVQRATSNSVQSRRRYLETLSRSCKSFSWYLENVLKRSVPVPSRDAQHFGIVRAHSGYCLSASSTSSENILFSQLCYNKNDSYQRHMLFEMSNHGALITDKLCVEPNNDGEVLLRKCQFDNPRQKWWFTDSHLTPMTSPRKCLTDRVQGSRTGQASVGQPKLEDCTDTARQHWTFAIL